MATSGMLRLPSGRLLQYYKNSVPQDSGLNDEVLRWMEQEAKKLNLSDFGKCGGIILDEMSIQVRKSSSTVRHINLIDETSTGISEKRSSAMIE